MNTLDALIATALKTVDRMAPGEAIQLAALISAEGEFIGRGSTNMKVGLRLLPTADGRFVAIIDDETVTMPMTRGDLDRWIGRALDRAAARRQEQEVGVIRDDKEHAA